MSAQASANVLLVDDDEDFAESLALLLQLSGHSVLVKTNASEALAQFAPGRFDMIILDVRLPEMDGLECFKRMRSLDPAARCVFVTGMRDEAMSREAIEKGALAVFDKPVPLERFFAVLDEHP